jgi:hypothetical protein
VPQRPQERGLPLHEGPGSDAPPFEDAKTESFFWSFLDPQSGQAVPFQSLERTSTSLSRLQPPQWNS